MWEPSCRTVSCGFQRPRCLRIGDEGGAALIDFQPGGAFRTLLKIAVKHAAIVLEAAMP